MRKNEHFKSNENNKNSIRFPKKTLILALLVLILISLVTTTFATFFSNDNNNSIEIVNNNILVSSVREKTNDIALTGALDDDVADVGANVDIAETGWNNWTIVSSFTSNGWTVNNSDYHPSGYAYTFNIAVGTTIYFRCVADGTQCGFNSDTTIQNGTPLNLTWGASGGAVKYTVTGGVVSIKFESSGNKCTLTDVAPTYKFYWGTTRGSTSSQGTMTLSGTTATYTMNNVSQNTTYYFGVQKTAGSTTEFYNHTNGQIIDTNCKNWQLNTGQQDCRIDTAMAGSYTFTFDTSTNKVSVSYPTSYSFYYGSARGSTAWDGFMTISGNTATYTKNINAGTTNYFAIKKVEDGNLTWYKNNGTMTQSSTHTWTFTSSESDCGITTKYTYNYTFSITGSSVTVGFPNEYTITFNSNGHGTAPSTQTVCQGTTATQPSNPSVTGWTFGGWYENQQCTGTQFSFSTAINSNKTLYAKWTVQTYNINYYDQGGSAFSGTHASGYPTTHTYGTATTLKTASKTGYTFGGWFTSSSCTGTAVTTLGANSYTSNISLYAKWTAKTYTITYYDQGGLTFSGTHATGYPTSHTYGTSTTLKTASKTGYTFGGWFTTSACSGSAITSLGATSYTSNISLYAKWTAKSFTVTLQYGSSPSSSDSTVNVTYGQAIPTVSKPTKTGYTFKGYYDAVSDGNLYIKSDGTSNKNWDKDVNSPVLYARWSNKKSTITLDYQGGTSTATENTITATYDMDMPDLSNVIPTKEGFVFDGYYTYNAKSSGKFYDNEGHGTRTWNGTSSAYTFYAHWIPRKLSFSFSYANYVCGGTSVTPTTSIGNTATGCTTSIRYSIVGNVDSTTTINQSTGAFYTESPGSYTIKVVATQSYSLIDTKDSLSYTFTSESTEETTTINALPQFTIDSFTYPTYKEYQTTNNTPTIVLDTDYSYALTSYSYTFSKNNSSDPFTINASTGAFYSETPSAVGYRVNVAVTVTVNGQSNTVNGYCTVVVNESSKLTITYTGKSRDNSDTYSLNSSLNSGLTSDHNIDTTNRHIVISEGDSYRLLASESMTVNNTEWYFRGFANDSGMIQPDGKDSNNKYYLDGSNTAASSSSINIYACYSSEASGSTTRVNGDNIERTTNFIVDPASDVSGGSATRKYAYSIVSWGSSPSYSSYDTLDANGHIVNTSLAIGKYRFDCKMLTDDTDNDSYVSSEYVIAENIPIIVRDIAPTGFVTYIENFIADSPTPTGTSQDPYYVRMNTSNFKLSVKDSQGQDLQGYQYSFSNDTSWGPTNYVNPSTSTLSSTAVCYKYYVRTVNTVNSIDIPSTAAECEIYYYVVSPFSVVESDIKKIYLGSSRSNFTFSGRAELPNINYYAQAYASRTNGTGTFVEATDKQAFSEEVAEQGNYLLSTFNLGTYLMSEGMEDGIAFFKMYFYVDKSNPNLASDIAAAGLGDLLLDDDTLASTGDGSQYLYVGQSDVKHTYFGTNTSESVQPIYLNVSNIGTYRLMARFSNSDDDVTWMTMQKIGSSNVYRANMPYGYNDVKFVLADPEKYNTDIDFTDVDDEFVFAYAAPSNLSSDISDGKLMYTGTIPSGGGSFSLTASKYSIN